MAEIYRDSRAAAVYEDRTGTTVCRWSRCGASTCCRASRARLETVHYNLYDYNEEKWAAGLRWDAHLRGIFFAETARVVPFQA